MVVPPIQGCLGSTHIGGGGGGGGEMLHCRCQVVVECNSKYTELMGQEEHDGKELIKRGIGLVVSPGYGREPALPGCSGTLHTPGK